MASPGALFGAALVAAAASLAHAAPFPHPRVTFAAEGSRASSPLKYCPKGGPCTMELRVLPQPLVVTPGKQVRLTFRPAPRAVDVTYQGGGRYARVVRLRPGTWAFRVRAAETGRKELLLTADYGRGAGTLGFTIEPR